MKKYIVRALVVLRYCSFHYVVRNEEGEPDQFFSGNGNVRDVTNVAESYVKPLTLQLNAKLNC